MKYFTLAGLVLLATTIFAQSGDRAEIGGRITR